MTIVGRGRGWLNINKHANRKPGIHSPVENTATNVYYNSTVITDTGPKLNPKYANIISKISLFDDSDDGILFNQKLKYIIEEFQKDCHNANDVEEAFASIHENSLFDSEFATKAIGMAATTFFNTLSVHGVNIRKLFIEHLQKDFEGNKYSPVKMLDDYYHKARLINRQPLKFLSSPMLIYLAMLLESTNEIDLKLFTVQLYMNGNNIRKGLPSKLSEFLIQARNMLAHNDRLSVTAKLWLMMALDISNNRYNFLPTELHKFYLTHLGDEEMSHIKKLFIELSIQA